MGKVKDYRYGFREWFNRPVEENPIPCESCGGDGGHHDFAGNWSRCVVCNGTGNQDMEQRCTRSANQSGIGEPT